MSKQDETKRDDTEGFGVAPETATANEGKEKAVPVDPVTNQPITDFFPTVGDEHQDAVDAQMKAVKVGSAGGRHVAAQQLIAAREANAEKQKANEAAVETTNAANPTPEAQIAMIPPDVYRAREQARVLAAAMALGTSTIRAGGEFIVNGQRVNANGERLD